MEIICDTNIWYGIADGTIPENRLNPKYKYVATFNCIDELSKTHNLLQCPDLVRKAIQKMFTYSKHHAIFEPPAIYLKEIGLHDYFYDVFSNHSQIIQFTELIAQGHSIDKAKEQEYKALLEKRREKLKEIASFFNDRAKIIKPNIKDKVKHRKEDTTAINRDFINKIVAHQTNSEGLSENFDWRELELFEKTLKVFFNRIETGAHIFRENDVYDLFLLVYVNPRRKIWTNEKFWLDLIKEAKMDKYLYRE
ncbi:MAG: hypothetical protein JJU28_17560 [Cyclobacteriaceae bacterium]|nr:hypothetical protein [Cyclobacteriaceae bacterium]